MEHPDEQMQWLSKEWMRQCLHKRCMISRIFFIVTIIKN